VVVVVDHTAITPPEMADRVAVAPEVKGVVHIQVERVLQVRDMMVVESKEIHFRQVAVVQAQLEYQSIVVHRQLAVTEVLVYQVQ
jgi:hypothetical protein